jgi:hypothetical protein
MKAPSTALARLARSREGLRQSLQDHPAGGGVADLDGYFSGLKSLPVAALLAELTKAWWHKQPLGAAGILLADALKAVIEAKLAPLAQRHPLALVCGAAALGGLLVWARPWRWGLVKPALLAGLAQQLLAKALNGDALEAWLAALSQPPRAATPHQSQ